MADWLPASGIAYVPAPELGGRRTPNADSPNIALRTPAFRAYADFMSTAEFRDALRALLAASSNAPAAVACSETLWWRCHRRLIADAAVLLYGVDVRHIVGSKEQPHRLTDGVRIAEPGTVRYDDTR